MHSEIAGLNSQGGTSSDTSPAPLTVGLFVWVAVLTAVVLIIGAVSVHRRYVDRQRPKSSSLDGLDLSSDVISVCSVQAGSISDTRGGIGKSQIN